jgi:hypothetical protein
VLCLTCWPLGCGGATDDEWSAKRPAVHPVHGTVGYQGKPVAGAAIGFSTEDGKPGASAISNEKGEFTLTTFAAGDGAVVGNHKVTVSKYETTGEDLSYSDPSSPNYGKDIPPEARGETKNLLPEKYASFQTSDLIVQVKEGNNEIPLDLKD